METPTIRPSRPEDDAHIVATVNALNPDWPPLTVQALRFGRGLQPEDANLGSFVAIHCDRVIGDVLWVRVTHVPEQRAYWCTIRVHPSCWGKGAGSALYAHMLSQVGADGANLLYAGYREDHTTARHFLQRRDFLPTGYINRQARLTVCEARLEMAQKANLRLCGEGVRVATLAELGPRDETLLRSAHRLDEEASADVPSSEKWSSKSFEEWRRQILDDPASGPSLCWLALEGDRVVGLAQLLRRGSENGFTAVGRGYRGRGIAQALKFHQIEWAQRHGVAFIITGNDAANGPMVKVNEALGYRPLPAVIEMVKELT
ncbi:MAG: GNAT family N-acetyltransferase [Chloroflexota bacterium]|nr:MAG: hypothetical protein DLM70_02685 [Chloroflexota bacterium]